jgi:signal transduction histidine kinase
VRVQFPEFERLVVADAHGSIVAMAGAAAPDTHVSATAWFTQGRLKPYVSDMPVIASISQSASADAKVADPRWIEIAVPLSPATGRDGGALAAFVKWSWVEHALSRIEEALSRHRRLELMLAARDGTVLAGPPAWSGRNLTASADLTEGGLYLVGQRAQLRLADGLGLGWIALVRQGADIALAPVRTTRRSVFAIVFVAGLLSAFFAVFVTRVLTRRLSTLATQAEAVRQGTQRRLAVPPGTDEVSRIGATLAEVVDHLQAEKQALQVLNCELDTRVIERTHRIERMAEAARHAAVTRERLRLARELHDTLAHSLMALLTQVRLIRKLRPNMSATDLDSELATAEGVAASGLSEARAAIGQMRATGVRDAGFGPAVQELARRFSERTGIVVNVEAAPGSLTWVDERWETAFRIIEEALRNVELHAQPCSVRISMQCSSHEGEASREGDKEAAGRARVEVVDDGTGFVPSTIEPGHYGLLGMKEQAAMIGASLDVQSQPRSGTQLILEMDV